MSQRLSISRPSEQKWKPLDPSPIDISLLELSDFLPNSFFGPTNVRGVSKHLDGGVEIYTAGPQQTSQGIIIIPDVLGWKSGHVRNYCDYFGSVKRFLTAVPNVNCSGPEGYGKFIFFS